LNTGLLDFKKMMEGEREMKEGRRRGRMSNKGDE
jgi:hypothetical protein